MPREEKGSPMGSYDNAPTGSGSDSGSSLAARRARLRGSLSRTTFPADETAYDQQTQSGEHPTTPSTEEQTEETPKVAQPKVERTSKQFDPAAATGAGGVAAQPVAQGFPASAANVSTPQTVVSTTLSNDHVTQYLSGSLLDSAQASAPGPSGGYGQALPAIPEHAIETLQNIDGVLNACATNLAALQRLSEEQTEVLKGLTTTLQNQTLFEIGLNLNSLTESLSAALEPMKAIGELVPAMDQLVSTLEARESDANTEKLSPDQLITSLADQLSAGLIDPWTFKCAYMAIYPSEHPADLLHRLVELLGTQRLSGDLFRAAYEAVQGAEPPNSSYHSRRGSLEDITSGIADDEIRARLEDLQRANEDLQRRQEERERELSSVLTQKEQELQEAQELLNSRYDEFNSRYDEVADMLNKREEEYRALLESKDMELVEKESELNLLRAQMEELRNQTEEMVKDLQKQLSDVKIAKEELANQQKQQAQAAAAANFFDPAPQARNQPTFDTAPAKQFFDGPSQSTSQGMPAVQPQQAPSQATSQGMPAVQPNTAAAPQQAAAAPANAQRQTGSQQAATTPFQGNSSGSYGSGVRAQVFEVIVRQALAGAPWREICAGPMQVNNISPDEVEAEVKRRQALLNK